LIALDGEVEFGLSEKGKDVAYHDCRMFHFHIKNKDETITTWRCSNCYKLKCKATLQTKNGRFLKCSDHICEVRPLEMGRKRFMEALKKAAKATSKSTARVVGTQLANADEALKGILPSTDSLKKSVRTHRSGNQRQVRKKPASLSELEIPNDFHFTKHGSLFLQFDTGMNTGNRRILCFGTPDSIAWLNNSTTVFADGTFKAAPQLFQQLYVIEGFLEPKVFPCLYFLLPAKSEAVYELMIKEVKNLCPNLNPTTIMTDFEPASINAFKKAWKNSKNFGCFFHFKQAIIQNFQKHDAVWKCYKQDLSITLTLNMLLALAYVPTADVLEAFDDLMGTEYFKEAYDADDGDILDEKTTALKHIVSYFEFTWIRRFNARTRRPKCGLFPLEMWNVHLHVLNGSQKTNNICEGFNSGFNSILQASNPTIWKFIDDLKISHEITDKGIVDVNCGVVPLPPKKRPKYVDFDIRIFMVVGNYSKYNTKLHFLKCIALSLNL